MALSVQIVTPRSVAWSGQAIEVLAPGELGEFGVLTNHTPLLTTLRAGVVKVRTESGVERFVVGTGFAEAGPDRVVILTESCEEAGKVNPEKAQADLAEAEAQLKAATVGSPAHIAATRKIALARARLAAMKG